VVAVVVVVAGQVAMALVVEGEVARALTQGSVAASLLRHTVRLLLRRHHSNKQKRTKPKVAKQATTHGQSHPRSEAILWGDPR
jgi:hypothetical protein